MGVWVEGQWCWDFSWNRDLSGRELDQLSNLFSIIRKFQVVAGETDGWRWKASPNGVFSVKTAYKSLCLETNPSSSSREVLEWKQIWKAPATFKAVTIAWKVLKGRLTTCDNLQKRNVAITNMEAICVLCKTKAEFIDHLFFECFKSEEIWKEIIRWIGKQAASQQKAKEHLLAFTNLGNKKDVSFLSGVWICTIWCIWKERNDCKFNQKKWSKGKLVAEIKSRMWGWRMAFNCPIFATEFRQWFTMVKLSD
ncbi:uncharacterized protein LOC131009581 [Salvia miltiorrhiza]|uniref:uncharacterized protein LOC131009581 n=1 Tax=Salvia miltiorrhiza TaxID=226208 RepID=UPI0025AC4B21|nr:uncharacterized protein LOC131009581 [Salvia miltiorrhiza]